MKRGGKKIQRQDEIKAVVNENIPLVHGLDPEAIGNIPDGELFPVG